MRRFLRFIGLGIAGLVAPVVLATAGLCLVSELSRRPHDHRTTWLDGPGDGRIRGVSWVEGGHWMDDPREIHEYSHVARNGRETLIGRGDAALDSDEVRLHADGDLAELVVKDDVFHRAREGKWIRFWAVDLVFIHLPLRPGPDWRNDGKIRAKLAPPSGADPLPNFYARSAATAYANGLRMEPWPEAGSRL